MNVRLLRGLQAATDQPEHRTHSTVRACGAYYSTTKAGGRGHIPLDLFAVSLPTTGSTPWTRMRRRRTAEGVHALVRGVKYSLREPRRVRFERRSQRVAKSTSALVNNCERDVGGARDLVACVISAHTEWISVNSCNRRSSGGQPCRTR